MAAAFNLRLAKAVLIGFDFSQPFLRYGYYILLASLALAAMGYLWLIVIGFRTRLAWGVGLLFPPVAPFFVVRHTRRARGPLILWALCGVAIGATYAAHALHNIDLGPREKLVAGEVHITLTGWDGKDYSILEGKPDTVVLQMANADVTDETLGHVKSMTRLRELDLNDTQITDAGLQTLSALPELRILRLRGTPITEAGFRTYLASKETLLELDMRNTKVPTAALREWKSKQPESRKYLR